MGMFSELAQLRKQEEEKQQKQAVQAVTPTPLPKQSTQLSGRTDVRTSGRRPTKRHPFEFYVDQLQSLEELATQERLSGKSGSMSAMVREALDEYLTKRKMG